MKTTSGLKHAVLLAPALMLAACGTNPNSLKAAATGGDIQLSQDFVYQLGDSRTRLVAGSYKSWKQGPAGTYYLGPPNCYRMAPTKASMWNGVRKDQVGKEQFFMDCGIFIAADKAKPPKVFTVLGTGVFAAGKQPELDPAAAHAITSTQPALQGAPIASGVGAGIGMGIVAAAVAAEQGNINIQSAFQPKGTALQEAIGLHPPAPPAASAPAPAPGTASQAPSPAG